MNSLGTILKQARETAQESLEEVSGAVEIDPQILRDYEAGEIVPPEEVLGLLINHFSLADEAATELWQLAGYEGHVSAEGDDGARAVSVPIKGRILYTDTVHVVSSKYGVVINFVQAFGDNGEPTIIARVGMSRDHAKSLLEVLQKSLEDQEESDSES